MTSKEKKELKIKRIKNIKKLMLAGKKTKDMQKAIDVDLLAFLEKNADSFGDIVFVRNRKVNFEVADGDNQEF
ncbi:MAG: hypothetical protein WCR79_01720 [Fusobacterium sp.]